MSARRSHPASRSDPSTRHLAPERSGRRLVEAILAEARARPGLEVIYLSVTDSNQEARRLYERPEEPEPQGVAALNLVAL